MQLYLVFKPARTRSYTTTVLDFVNDFFVRNAELVAVCATLESANEVVERVMADLRADCNVSEVPYDVNTATWLDFLPTAMKDAITLVGEGLRWHGGTQPPSKVHVVLRRSKKRIWGGDYREQVRVRSINASEPLARRDLIPGVDEIVEYEVIGIPATV